MHGNTYLIIYQQELNKKEVVYSVSEVNVPKVMPLKFWS